MSVATAAPADTAAATQKILDDVAKLAERDGRKEPAAALRTIGAAEEGAARLVVAGELKRGKSSLVNALLSRPGLSPVDTLVATTTYVALVYASPERARVFFDGRPEPLEVPVEEVAQYVSEQANPGNEKGVRMVELGLDHPLLRELVIVDTPGVGGLNAAHREITLEALRQADALLFVLDAATEITKPELDFLQQVTEGLATVLIVLAKSEAYDWAPRLDRDRELLHEHAPRFLESPVLPVSSRLKDRADKFAAQGNAQQAESDLARSGFAPLEAEIRRQVIGRSASIRALNALQYCRTVLDRIAEPRYALAGGETTDTVLHERWVEAHARLKELGESSRVGDVRVAEEFTNLGKEVELELGRRLDELKREYEARIQKGDLKSNELGRELKEATAAMLVSLQSMIDERVIALLQRVAKELEVALKPLGERDFEAAPDLPIAPRQRDPVTSAAGLVGLISSFVTARSLSYTLPELGLKSLVGVFNPLLGAAGLAIAGLQFASRTRSEDKQHSMRAVADAYVHLRRELPPIISQRVVGSRRLIEEDLKRALAERTAELTAANEARAKEYNEDKSAREARRDAATAMLAEIASLRARIDTVFRTAAGGAS